MTREQLAILFGVVVLAVFGLMWLGWRARAKRQTEYPEPSAIPAGLATPLFTADIAYVATTADGDPIDRITVHDLGFRGNGQIIVHPQGVAIVRDGSRDFFIPAADVADAEPASVAVDRGVEKDGLVAINWSLGDRLVSTVVRTRRAQDNAALRSAVNTLTENDEEQRRTEPDGR